MRLAADLIYHAQTNGTTIIATTARLKALCPMTEAQAALFDAQVDAALQHIQRVLQAGFDRSEEYVQHAPLSYPAALPADDHPFLSGIVRGLSLGKAERSRRTDGQASLSGLMGGLR
jgi:hypothetical protein